MIVQPHDAHGRRPSSNGASGASSLVAKPSLLSKVLPPPEAKQLLLSTLSMLKSVFWPVILIYAIKDAASFLLHRMGHRLTNLGELS